MSVSSRHLEGWGFSGEQDGQSTWTHQAYDLEGEEKVVKQGTFGLKRDLTERTSVCCMRD